MATNVGPDTAAAPGAAADQSAADDEEAKRERRFSWMAPHQRAALEDQRQRTRTAAAIAGTSWGQGMNHDQRLWVAAYCHRYGLDPMTELDWLGGGVYVNAEYFVRILGEMRRAGIIADHWLEHIQADPRLRALMEDESFPPAAREMARQRWLESMIKRVERNAPEDAEAICVCYIVLPGGGHPIVGCKWAGGGTSVLQPKSGRPAEPNPITENNPTLSVESGAIRRAMRQLASHVPTLESALAGMEADLKDFNSTLRSQRATATATATAEAPRGPAQSMEPEELYGLNAGARQGAVNPAPERRALSAGPAAPVQVPNAGRAAVPVTVADESPEARAAAQRVAAQALAEIRDPYREDPRPAAEAVANVRANDPRPSADEAAAALGSLFTGEAPASQPASAEELARAALAECPDCGGVGGHTSADCPRFADGDAIVAPF